MVKAETEWDNKTIAINIDIIVAMKVIKMFYDCFSVDLS